MAHVFKCVVQKEQNEIKGILREKVKGRRSRYTKNPLKRLKR
jgi:hypothetical protein